MGLLVDESRAIAPWLLMIACCIISVPAGRVVGTGAIWGRLDVPTIKSSTNAFWFLIIAEGVISVLSGSKWVGFKRLGLLVDEPPRYCASVTNDNLLYYKHTCREGGRCGCNLREIGRADNKVEHQRVLIFYNNWEYYKVYLATWNGWDLKGRVFWWTNTALSYFVD